MRYSLSLSHSFSLLSSLSSGLSVSHAWPVTRLRSVGMIFVFLSQSLLPSSMLFILFRYFMTHGIIVKLREFHIPLLAAATPTTTATTMTFCGLPSLHKSLRDSVKVFLSPAWQSDISRNPKTGISSWQGQVSLFDSVWSMYIWST